MKGVACLFCVTRLVGSKIRAAKRAARSELSVSKGEWRKHGYADSDVLSLEGVVDNVQRVHISVSGNLLQQERVHQQHDTTVLQAVLVWHACCYG